MEVLLDYSTSNVITVREGLKLSSLKPRLMKTIVNLYRFLKTDKQKEIILNGWKTAEVTELIFYVMHK